MNEYFDLDASQPLVLLIGFNTSSTSSGILNTIKASGRQYKIKMLESSVENWESILEYFTDFDIRCVVVRLSGGAYRNLADPLYQDASDDLVKQIAQVPHAVFAHERLLNSGPGRDENEEEESMYSPPLYPPPPVEVLEAVNSYLEEADLNVLSYYSSAELNVLASNFITETDEGLIFRIYVPNDRIWANETDRLIQLFRDYLARVGQLSIRLDQQRTNHGIVYEFYNVFDAEGADLVEPIDLPTQFHEFSSFLDLAVFNPSEAEAILKI